MSFSYCLFISGSLLFCLSSFYMEGLRVGSLNRNGGRDAQKRAVIPEVIQQKRLDVVLSGKGFLEYKKKS